MKEPPKAREAKVSPLNAESKVRRSTLSTVNKKIESILDRDNLKIGEGLNHYAKYGDIEWAELHKDGTLEVSATGKGYGDSKSESGEVKIMSDSEYRDNAPRFFYDWRGEYTVSDVDIDYAANSLVRDIKKMGRTVKKIKYDYYWD